MNAINKLKFICDIYKYILITYNRYIYIYIYIYFTKTSYFKKVELLIIIFN